MKPLKVSEVNNYIKRIFQRDMILSNLQIEGEISNFKHHYSGHMYFSLKDEKSKIRCIMFRSDNENLTFKLEEGMKVTASGYISVYEREGDYQFYIRDIKAKGVGDLYKAFDELKNKLSKEGLFDEKYKKEIPAIPKKIGIVTSSTGAAIRDIISIIKRRYPPCNLLIYPTLVQGPDAPMEICQGLKYLDSRGDIDLIITGRGGGSFEELNAFNDEELARTIFSLKTPIISAVGHETDFTIADFVADVRAATPSAAAELAVPDISYLKDNLRDKYFRLTNYIDNRLKRSSEQLNPLKRSLEYNNPLNKIRDNKQDLDSIFKDLNYFIERKLSREMKRIIIFEHRLNLLNPTHSLDKGFGLLYNKEGKIIKSAFDVRTNEEVNILMKDGKVKTIVLNVEKGEEPDER